MIDKKILNYDVKMLTAWLAWKAGSSNPDYFGAQKGELGLDLQQVPQEYAQILDWFRNQNFESYLELGVGRGGSFLLNVVFQTKLKDAICVDNSEYWKDSQKEDIRNKVEWLNTHRGAFVDFCDMTTDEYFSRDRGVEMFDCIFIDADHSETGVYKDYKNSLNHIKDGGYIILHDVASSQCPGVVKLYNEIKDENTISFIHGNHCGISIHKIKL